MGQTESVLTAPTERVVDEAGAGHRCQLIAGVPGVAVGAVAGQVAVCVVREALRAEGEHTVRRVVRGRGHRLRQAGARPGAADLGAVAGRVVGVGEVAQQRRSVLVPDLGQP